MSFRSLSRPIVLYKETVSLYETIGRERLLVFAEGWHEMIGWVEAIVNTQMEFVLVSRKRLAIRSKSSESESGPCVKGCGDPFG